MPARKKKEDYGFTYVILGLVLGFFLGSGIVYWYSNRHNDSLLANNIWNYLASVFQGNEKSSVYVVSESDSDDLNYEPRRQRPLPNPSPGAAQVLQDTLPDIAENILLLEEVELNDSLLMNRQITELQQGNHLAADPEISLQGQPQPSLSPQVSMRIAHDRLLLIRAYNLPATIQPTTQSQSMRQLDSLLGNFPRRTALENMLLVEFWQSPLNFRGYKMSHNKLIVYGLDQVDAFSLHSDGNSFYIKYFDNFYPVNQTMEYKPLTPLVDPVLLDEFQQRWP